MALGMSGHPDAFPLLAEYAGRPVSGEVDRPTFRTRTRLALAMGHLARKDPRALHWLLTARGAARDRAAPGTSDGSAASGSRCC